MKKKLLNTLLIASVLGIAPVQAKSTIEVKGVVYSLDTIYHAKVGPGTTQTHLELVSPTKSKLQVHYLTVDKSAPGVSMRAVSAKDMVAGTERPSAMAKRKSGNGVLYFAGTNADFYATGGTATNGSSKVGSPTAGCTADRETYKTSNGLGDKNYQFSIDVDGVARISRLYYYAGTATLGDKVAAFKGINVASPDNGITIYTPKYWGSTNQTTKAGSCAEVTAKLVDGDKMYAGCKFRLEVTSTANSTGDTAIPSDGYVIHGRGEILDGEVSVNALNFVNGLQVGDVVEFDNVVLTEKGSTERIVPAQIVSGNPKNVGGGLTLDTESERADANQLHPRTGIGVSVTGDSIIMMVVDGRSSISAGVRTSQLADIMRYAGAWEAMNLDGGGSSCLYTSALGVRNVGSDGNERAVGNGIFAVVTAPEDKEIAEIRFVDWAKELPQYGIYTPKFYGYNKYGVLVDTDLQGVTLSCPATLGEVVEEGTSLYCSGTGSHLLTATYKGVSNTIVVTVGSENNMNLRKQKVLLDSYKDYTAEVFGIVKGVEFPIYNKAITWTSDDATIASVDETGTIKGLKNGTTIVKGKFNDFVGEINVTVEIPTTRYKLIDDKMDISTWSLTGTNVSNISLEACGADGIRVNYTTTSARNVGLTLEKTLTSWSRPDSLLIEINPTTANIKNFYLYFTDYRDADNKKEFKYTPSLILNEVNSITLPMNEIVDLNDMSTYPLVLDSINFVPGNTKGTTHTVEFKKIAWVYNSIPGGNSGVETIVKSTNDLQISPNPVNSGEVVKLKVNAPVEYSVFSINGSLIKTGNGEEISTVGMSAGIYVVSVIQNGKKQVARLIIK